MQSLEQNISEIVKHTANGSDSLGSEFDPASSIK